MIQHRFAYKGFTLECKPMRMSSGRYSSQVAVLDGGGKEAFGRAFPAGNDFSSEAEAVAHGKASGERWIDEQGQREGQ